MQYFFQFVLVVWTFFFGFIRLIDWFFGVIKVFCGWNGWKNEFFGTKNLQIQIFQQPQWMLNFGLTSNTSFANSFFFFIKQTGADDLKKIAGPGMRAWAFPFFILFFFFSINTFFMSFLKYFLINTPPMSFFRLI